MPKYRVLEKSLIGDRLRYPGEIVDYNDEPGPNLKLAAASAPLGAHQSEPLAENEIYVGGGAYPGHRIDKEVGRT